MSTTLATANLNFGRTREAHRADVREMRETGAAIICTQEDLRDGKRRERITAGRRVQRLGRGSIQSTLDRLGQKIGWRRFVYLDCDLPGIDLTRVVDVHIAPRRMPVLQKVYAARLRRFLARSPYPWIVAGDWNHFLRNDPCGLRARFDVEWVGAGIDGYAIHPDLVQFVEDCWHVDRPKRNDGHPFVYLKLSARPTRKESR